MKALCLVLAMTRGGGGIGRWGGDANVRKEERRESREERRERREGGRAHDKDKSS